MNMRQNILMSIITLLFLNAGQVTACPTIPISRGAYYSGTKLPGCTIVFTGAGSYDTDSYFGSITPCWKWDFDYNGTFTIDITTTNAYPTWTYSQAGTYTVAVQFIDDDGQCGAIYTFQITISGLKRLYYVKDHLGSIRVTVDSTGNIVSYDDYDPWGMQLEGRSANYGSANEKYKFTGKERDVETGYDYFGARYYDSRIGRWMSVDPLADVYTSVSPYNYSLGNPIIVKDVGGKFPISVHAEVESRIKGISYWQAYFRNAIIDYLGAPINSLHFDNYGSFADISNQIEGAGGFLNMDDHTIGDFYSHSNYVDVWYNMNPDNPNMPTYDEIDWNSDFGKAVKAQLETTAFPDFLDPGKGHNGGGGQRKKGMSFKSKDKPGKLDRDIALYSLAYGAFGRSLERKYSSGLNIANGNNSSYGYTNGSALGVLTTMSQNDWDCGWSPAAR